MKKPVFNMFRIWDRITLKECLDPDRKRRWDVPVGKGTDPDYANEYVSVSMDDGRFYQHVHVGWLELCSPTIKAKES